jgi:hypothetical protein
MRRLEDPRRSPSVSLHTPHSNASSSDMHQQQRPQYHQPTQVTMNIPWQQQQEPHQPHLDRRMSFTAPNPPVYTSNTATAPPNILTTMLPPAPSTFDLQNPSPTGFLDPSSLSTGSSSLRIDQGGSHMAGANRADGQARCCPPRLEGLTISSIPSPPIGTCSARSSVGAWTTTSTSIWA